MSIFNNKYPYTDLHELNLDWVIGEVKRLAEEWAQTKTEWTTTRDAWTELYNYVHDYFDNLNVQEEVNTKVDALVADGTFAAIVTPIIHDYADPVFEDQTIAINTAITEQNANIQSYTDNVNVLTARMDSFSRLAEGSTTGDAELIDIRVAADGQTYENAGDAVRGQVNDLNKDIDDSNIKPLSSMKTYNGNIGATGNWFIDDDKYKHILIPLSNGDVVEIEGGDNTYMGFLTSYSSAISGQPVPFSNQEGYNSRIIPNVRKEYITPSDAIYLCIVILFNNVEVYPTVLNINGVDYIVSIRKYLEDVNNGFSKVYPPYINGTYTIDGQTTDIQGYKRTPFYLSTESYQKILNPNMRNIYIAKYDENKHFIERITSNSDVINISTYAVGFNDVRYIRFHIEEDYTDEIYLTSLYPAYKYAFDSLYDNSVKWCAMGDSITEGWVSFVEGSTPTADVMVEKGWAYLLASKYGWSLDNKAIGGTGYLKPTNAQESAGIDTTSGKYIAQHTDFTKYNIVTLAFGINDWKANKNIDDVINAMKTTIESILHSNPICKVLVILPLNSAGYNFEYGDETSNWGLGYRFSNSGTLEEFANNLINVCKYYGIEYIDMTHSSCVNRLNLPNCLLDGVHPSEDTHKLLSYELSKKINF